MNWNLIYAHLGHTRVSSVRARNTRCITNISGPKVNLASFKRRRGRRTSVDGSKFGETWKLDERGRENRDVACLKNNPKYDQQQTLNSEKLHTEGSYVWDQNSYRVRVCIFRKKDSSVRHQLFTWGCVLGNSAVWSSGSVDLFIRWYSYLLHNELPPTKQQFKARRTDGQSEFSDVFLWHVWSTSAVERTCSNNHQGSLHGGRGPETLTLKLAVVTIGHKLKRAWRQGVTVYRQGD